MNENFEHNAPIPDSIKVVLDASRSSELFQVPEHYFENLSTALHLRVKANADDLKIPAGYFKDANHKIMAAIESEHADDAFFAKQRDEIFEAIKAEKHPSAKDEFLVPDEYFEVSSKKIISATSGARIFQLRHFLGYVAAAAVIVVAFFFIYPKSQLHHVGFASLVEQSDLQVDDLEFFADEEDIYDLYLEVAADTLVHDTLVTDSLMRIENNMLLNDSIRPKIKLDPKTGLPLDPKNKTKAPSWDDMTDEELMQYLFEEGADDLLNEMD